MGKQKKQMGSAEKANSRARKEPQTAARKKARRDAQLKRELENKALAGEGVMSPWQISRSLRVYNRRESGAA